MIQYRIRNKWPDYLAIYGEDTMQLEMPSKGLQEQTALFERLLNDLKIHAEALAELERRRQRNTETIRGYGLL